MKNGNIMKGINIKFPTDINKSKFNQYLYLADTHSIPISNSISLFCFSSMEKNFPPLDLIIIQRTVYVVKYNDF